LTDEVVTKKAFAALVKVTPSCVSHWIGTGKIGGDALVGTNCRARVRVGVALAQLGRNLDPVQHLGDNGRAKLGAAAAAPIEDGIKAARLTQLELANAKARAEAAVLSGRYVEASGARQEMGKIAGRMVAAFEGALPELADAVAAESSIPPRDALHALRTAWRAVRARLSGVEAEVALAEPETLGAAQ
jgi:hypothetical protein